MATIDAEDRAEQLLDSSDCNQLDEIEQDDLTVQQIDPVLELAQEFEDIKLNNSYSIKPRTGAITSRHVNEKNDDTMYALNDVSDRSDDDDKRDILHVGDGNFTFTLAYISFIEEVLLQPDIARRIVATEVKSESELFEDSDVRRTIELLRNKGVIILFEVDALQLDRDARLQKYRFRCIRWNNPCFGGIMFSDNHKQLKETMPQFYRCAARKLAAGGMLIVTIEQAEESSSDKNLYKYKQALVSLVSGTTRCGFALLLQNQRFNKMYIPFGYKHRMTKSADSRDKHHLTDRTEFVFEQRNQNLNDRAATEILQLFNQLYRPTAQIIDQPSVRNMIARGYKLVAVRPQVVTSLPYPVINNTQFDLLFDYQKPPFPGANPAHDHYGPQIGDYKSKRPEHSALNDIYFDREYAVRMALQIPVNVSLNNPSLTSVSCYNRV